MTVRRSCAAVLLAAAALHIPGAGAQEIPVAFEVASVKPNTSSDGRTLIQTPPGRFTATNAQLSLLIGFAYEMQRFRLAGINAPS
jgi:hypothetical protein